jgi:hypothetical protein
VSLLSFSLFLRANRLIFKFTEKASLLDGCSGERRGTPTTASHVVARHAVKRMAAR